MKHIKIPDRVKEEIAELRKKVCGADLEKLNELNAEMQDIDKKLSHDPVKLYCLGCGRLISKTFTGGLWSYTHSCGSRMLGSKEYGLMYPTSLVLGYKSFPCKSCKTEEEHTTKNIEEYFGKSEFKCDDSEIVKVREEAIETVKRYSSEKYGIETRHLR